MNRVTQSLSNSRVQSWVEFVRAIKISCGLVELLFVKFSEATVKEGERGIVDRQALQKLLVFPQIEIAVQHRTVALHEGSQLTRPLAFRHGFVQHSSESVCIPEFPV